MSGEAGYKESLVSIIVPIYNSQLTIDRCIKSILAQSYSNLDIILINDGSIDDSLYICEGYAKEDKRISLLNQKNSGPSKARNVGLNVAKGDYVLFIDSDDYVETDLVEKCVNVFRTYECDMVIFGFCYESESKKRIHSFTYKNGLYEGSHYDDLAIDLIDDNSAARIPAYSPIRMTKSSVFKDKGLRFNESIVRSEDYLFWTQVYFCISSLYIMGDTILYHYVKTSNSITNRYLPNYWDMIKTIYFELAKTLPNNRITENKLKNMLVQRSLVALHNASDANSAELFERDCDYILNDIDLKRAVNRVGLYNGSLRSRIYCVLIQLHLNNIIKKLFAK